MQRINLVIIAIILIGSKEQYNIDLSNTGSNSYLNEIMKCTGNENLNTCTSVSMSSGVYQCCRVKVTTKTYYSYENDYNSFTTDICSVWLAQQITDKELQIAEDSFSESAAFLKYAYDIYVPLFSMTYSCKSKTYTFNYNMKIILMKRYLFLEMKNIA